MWWFLNFKSKPNHKYNSNTITNKFSNAVLFALPSIAYQFTLQRHDTEYIRSNCHLTVPISCYITSFLYQKNSTDKHRYTRMLAITYTPHKSYQQTEKSRAIVSIFLNQSVGNFDATSWIACRNLTRRNSRSAKYPTTGLDMTLSISRLDWRNGQQSVAHARS